ncbi:50S ribosomal protein L25/general stress protein Ctc [Malikia spinosa]|jgi:large subunit ribosomal protein L25|uniref:Large ribosomal subunit protein bL25 n=1 Tax=Malikia spinosa TaxID=86180 RepID=A0A2S9KFI5_9BURK|nr:50S ribosomal protein L25/general stress protein Ctc [Malikia spinosa]MYZ52135.1 50S ribosomal protein L25/general stress protein Ctc [Malikia spinosa]OGB70736.1 MAG: 50S ribosomal protein L25/general stress protein Ctc [Burkholderiales bacterium RIFOXYC12_FULL_65_23]PRD69213.1 50S ribosomal protein L25 [Malikia spinosa]
MQFTAFERAKQGTGASRRLRNTGRTPAIVFGGTTAPAVVELDHNSLWFALKKESFHSALLDMELNGNTEKVVLRNVQYHPFKPLVLHVDFQRVDETTRVRKKVPLHFINAEHSPAVKQDKCLVNHALTEVVIDCLAMQIPEFITVDLGNAVKGQSIHTNDLVLPAGAKLVIHGKPNPGVASLVEPKEEIIAAPVAAASTDKKKKKK